ncbi:MAG: hypothetical protein IPH65_17550 [Dehalococcoidia bacterium]|uniref:hypothetical protein n=1 Tax=Candidatus Amarobacter glycogenicus TaxID=3140699 RepID=UPI003135D074|nr:hypothetical protein [Dehalococcoidia bacterium]
MAARTRSSVAPASPLARRAVASADSVSYAFLVMLEELGLVERAVFLREVSPDYDYAEIAPLS